MRSSRDASARLVDSISEQCSAVYWAAQLTSTAKQQPDVATQHGSLCAIEMAPQSDLEPLTSLGILKGWHREYGEHG